MRGGRVTITRSSGSSTDYAGPVESVIDAFDPTQHTFTINGQPEDLAPLFAKGDARFSRTFHDVLYDARLSEWTAELHYDHDLIERDDDSS